MIKSATFSDCNKYRYTLERIWDESKPLCMFIGLNPSTADAEKDDPTIRRCISYARIWGYGGLIMANLFGFRAADPKEMMAAADPIGPDNDQHIKSAMEKSALVVGAWGNHGLHKGRTNSLRRKIDFNRIAYLKFTISRQPAHPLYLPKNLKPIYMTAGEYVEIPGSGEQQGELF